MMGLRGKALLAAQELLKAFPDAQLASGKRDRESQARAMAGNLVMNRSWIPQTYRQPLCKVALQCHLWVANTPSAVSQSDIAAGLLSIMQGFGDDELGKLTLHLSGDAFDVRKLRDKVRNGQMKAYLHELAHKHGGTFLEREGGIEVLHFQVRG